MTTPDFLIIGEMKCGTTTLYDVLVQHPMVFERLPKELHQLGSYAFNGACGENFGDPEIKRYCENFSNIPSHLLAGEATPSYLFDPLAPERIACVAPNARLIVILRDPIKRAFSHYRHQFVKGRERLSFAKALALEDERVAKDTDHMILFSYRTRGCYIRSLKRYETAWRDGMLMVVFQEELVRSPLATANRIFTHLGLDPVDEISLPHRNRASYPRSESLERLKQRVKRTAESMPSMIYSIVEGAARVTRPLRTTRNAHISHEIYHDLEQFYAPYDAELEAWLDRPVPWRQKDD